MVLELRSPPTGTGIAQLKQDYTSYGNTVRRTEFAPCHATHYSAKSWKSVTDIPVEAWPCAPGHLR